MSKQDVYVAKMKLQLDELNLKMAEVETRAADARDDARAAYDDEMVKLREHSRAAGAQFDALKAAAEGNWHQLVSEMEKLRSAFTGSFKHFRTQA